MTRFAIILIFVSVTAAELQEPLRLTEPISIRPNSKYRALYSDAGIITGARSCGGSGKFLRARYEECTTGLPGPCVARHNSQARSEVVFVPSDDSEGVGVRSTIFTLDGQIKQYENILDDVKLVAGEEYVLNSAGGGGVELRGRHVTGQIEIFRLTDKKVEICAQADYFVV